MNETEPRCRSAYCWTGSVLPGAALTRADSHGVAVLWGQGLAHRRDFGRFGCDHLALEVKESTAARTQAVPCQFFTELFWELFLGCCIHPYRSSYRDSLEAGAYRWVTSLLKTRCSEEYNLLGCAGAAAGERTYTTARGSSAAPGQRQLESSAARRWWWWGKRRNELQEKAVAEGSPQKRLGAIDLGAGLFKQQSS